MGYALDTIPSLFFTIIYTVKIINDNKVNDAIIDNRSKETAD